MYTQPPFRTDRAASLAFAATRGFGTVCAWDGNKPIASALPFCVSYGDDGTPYLAFHVARGNPLIHHADGIKTWLMAVNGADAYISADWYVSPDQVPTWLYQAVHFTGAVRVMSENELGSHLDALSAKFESWLAPKPPWTSSKMSVARLATMKKAIVGLVMTVDEIEGAFKLNQHKSDADYVAVEAELARQQDTGTRHLANEMRSRKPHLFATEIQSDDVTPQGTLS